MVEHRLPSIVALSAKQRLTIGAVSRCPAG
jgi:hypothetical protein